MATNSSSSHQMFRLPERQRYHSKASGRNLGNLHVIDTVTFPPELDKKIRAAVVALTPIQDSIAIEKASVKHDKHSNEQILTEAEASTSLREKMSALSNSKRYSKQKKMFFPKYNSLIRKQRRAKQRVELYRNGNYFKESSKYRWFRPDYVSKAVTDKLQVEDQVREEVVNEMQMVDQQEFETLEDVSDAAFDEGDFEEVEVASVEDTSKSSEIPVGFRKYKLKYLHYKRFHFFRPKVFDIHSERTIVNCLNLHEDESVEVDVVSEAEYEFENETALQSPEVIEESYVNKISQKNKEDIEKKYSDKPSKAPKDINLSTEVSKKCKEDLAVKANDKSKSQVMVSLDGSSKPSSRRYSTCISLGDSASELYQGESIFQSSLDTWNSHLIGLEYLVEIRDTAERTRLQNHHCFLCDEDLVEDISADVVINHIVGCKHVVKYMEKHFPSCGYKFSENLVNKSCEVMLQECCEEINNRLGYHFMCITNCDYYQNHKKNIEESLNNATHWNEITLYQYITKHQGSFNSPIILKEIISVVDDLIGQVLSSEPKNALPQKIFKELDENKSKKITVLIGDKSSRTKSKSVKELRGYGHTPSLIKELRSYGHTPSLKVVRDSVVNVDKIKVSAKAATTSISCSKEALLDNNLKKNHDKVSHLHYTSKYDPRNANNFGKYKVKGSFPIPVKSNSHGRVKEKEKQYVVKSGSVTLKKGNRAASSYHKDTYIEENNLKNLRTQVSGITHYIKGLMSSESKVNIKDNKNKHSGEAVKKESSLKTDKPSKTDKLSSDAVKKEFSSGKLSGAEINTVKNFTEKKVLKSSSKLRSHQKAGLHSKHCPKRILNKVTVSRSVTEATSKDGESASGFVQNNDMTSRSVSWRKHIPSEEIKQSGTVLSLSSRTVKSPLRTSHSSFQLEFPSRRIVRSPVNRHSKSPQRRRSRTPVRKRFKSPIRKRSESPMLRQLSSPTRRHSRSLSLRRSKSPARHRSRSPARHRSRSPARRRSRSPGRQRSRSPVRRRSRSPARRRSRSPARRRSRSPIRHRSRSPGRRRSRSPGRRRSRSPGRRHSRSPGRRHSRSPARRRSRSPFKRYSPSNRYSRSPITNSRSPVRRHGASRSSRSPVRRHSKSPLNSWQHSRSPMRISPSSPTRRFDSSFRRSSRSPMQTRSINVQGHALKPLPKYALELQAKYGVAEGQGLPPYDDKEQFTEKEPNSFASRHFSHSRQYDTTSGRAISDLDSISDEDESVYFSAADKRRQSEHIKMPSTRMMIAQMMQKFSMGDINPNDPSMQKFLQFINAHSAEINQFMTPQLAANPGGMNIGNNQKNAPDMQSRDVQYLFTNVAGNSLQQVVPNAPYPPTMSGLAMPPYSQPVFQHSSERVPSNLMNPALSVPIHQQTYSGVPPNISHMNPDQFNSFRQQNPTMSSKPKVAGEVMFKDLKATVNKLFGAENVLNLEKGKPIAPGYVTQPDPAKWDLSHPDAQKFSSASAGPKNVFHAQGKDTDFRSIPKGSIMIRDNSPISYPHGSGNPGPYFHSGVGSDRPNKSNMPVPPPDAKVSFCDAPRMPSNRNLFPVITNAPMMTNFNVLHSQSNVTDVKISLAQRLASVLVKVGMMDVPAPLLQEMLMKIGAFSSCPPQDIRETEIISILKKLGYLS